MTQSCIIIVCHSVTGEGACDLPPTGLVGVVQGADDKQGRRALGVRSVLTQRATEKAGCAREDEPRHQNDADSCGACGQDTSVQTRLSEAAPPDVGPGAHTMRRMGGGGGGCCAFVAGLFLLPIPQRRACPSFSLPWPPSQRHVLTAFLLLLEHTHLHTHMHTRHAALAHTNAHTPAHTTHMHTHQNTH